MLALSMVTLRCPIDDAGVPGLIIAGLALVTVVISARRLRLAMR